VTHLWAGAARTSITPPLGIAHGGWGAQVHERAEGADGELFATALVLADAPGLEIAIADLDLCVLMDDQCDAIRAAIADLTRIPRERVRVSYSHTHAAPVTNVITGGWIRAGRELVEPYLGVLPGLVAGAVRQARIALAPCHIGAGMGECRIGVNRRLALGPNRVVAGHNWDGPIDPTVSVLRIDDEDTHPIATLVHYSCHPTTAGPGNRLLSPDYPGSLRGTVETTMGGVCLFLQGAAGDIGPIGGFTADLAVPRRLGSILGSAATNVALQINTQPLRERAAGVQESGHSLLAYELEPSDAADDTLGAESTLLSLPLRRPPAALSALEATARQREDELYALRAGGAAPNDVMAATAIAKRAAMAAERARVIAATQARPLELQAFRIGPVGLVGVGLEPFCSIGANIRDASPFPVTMFSGYTNGYRTYLPTEAELPRGGYEVEIGVHAEGAVAQLEQAALDALERLAARGSSPRPPQGPPWSYGTARDHTRSAVGG
jgi:hypothetical protein